MYDTGPRVLRSHYNTAPFSHLLQQAVDLFATCMTRVFGFRGLIISHSLFIHLLQQLIEMDYTGRCWISHVLLYLIPLLNIRLHLLDF